ncbi:hypothetical protein [Paenibacillus sp. ATY16]|uniref:hypothetical protein n=1 Tax=Paenibacillus sp. ATY16 TaxID=1759312 RepID=UPI00200E101B|nr:hypothetical protein [Paenibacillus sp. ATY16]
MESEVCNVEYFDDEEIRRGRNLVKSIILIVLSLELFNNLYFIITNGYELENSLKKLIYSVLVITISCLLYKGYRWAWYVVFLMLIQDILSGLFYLLQKSGLLLAFDGWLMLMLTIIVAVFGGMFLGASRSITAFIKYQQDRKPK